MYECKYYELKKLNYEFDPFDSFRLWALGFKLT